MRLIINGFEVELSNGTDIARTLQVNDIATFSNRQANFTNTFTLPRTAKNIRTFANLGIVGANSTSPYQRNETYLYADSGECLVYNGWSVITSTDENYKINVIDGNVDLYKAIENTTLAELPLTEINHTKTLDTVVDSFTNNGDYKYILADYNGNMIYGGNKINIDYLVPSANVPYLWDKIFDFYGFTYSGNVFNTFAFQNLWLTFAKGVFSEPESVDMLYSKQLQDENYVFSQRYNIYLKVENFPPVNNFLSIISNKHFQIDNGQEGSYKVNISGQIAVIKRYLNNPDFNAELWIGKNASGLTADSATPIVFIGHVPVGDVTTPNVQTIDFTAYVQMQPFDSLCIIVKATSYAIGSVVTFPNNSSVTTEPLIIDIKRIEGQDVDFNTSFIDFKTTDFLNEVVNRFGLSMFKDKYTNHYTFKTLTELLQDNEVIDWSADKSKFVSVNSESYIYGSYARQNNLKYKYNDQESDYYNGSLNINNVNLKDSTDIFKSNIYAPEKLTTNVLGKETNVYKFWEKEPKDDGATTYKSLDKRFYLLRSDDYTFPSARTIGSEKFTNETTITVAPFESFYKLPFNDIVQEYYLPMYQILNQSKIYNLNIYLKEQDIVNVDFSKLYWVKELSNYFILNKISNFRGNGATKCEMIKVDYVPSSFLEVYPYNLIVLYRENPNDRNKYIVSLRFGNWVSGGTIDYVLDGNAPVTISYAPDGFNEFIASPFEIEGSNPAVTHTLKIINNGNESQEKTFTI